jgi:hypothetical protein
MSRQQKYTCVGSVRGACGAQHRSLSGALACCARDLRACKRLPGGHSYSDRTPVRTDGSPFTAEEELTVRDWEDTPL